MSSVAFVPAMAMDGECTPGEQYRFLSTDSEGEEILMYATCIWDSEISAYTWYRSNFDPTDRGDG